ncbi:transposase family protein [Actinomadura sp. NAK00032]|nr:transposase family protein [Actinomadura sp. NAK00032]
MLFYRAAVDLSRPTLNYLAGVIRRHRKAIGSAWRLLNPGQQALLVLVHLRKGDTFTELGAGFEISTSTAWLPNDFVKPLRACSRCWRGRVRWRRTPTGRRPV